MLPSLIDIGGIGHTHRNIKCIANITMYDVA